MSVALALLVGACSRKPRRPLAPRPEVSVLTIEPQSIPYTPTFVAQTESSRQVNIVARVSGFLDSILYSEGDLVKQGQLMFKLDPKPFQAQLNAAKGALQAQQARLETAEVTIARVKPLADQDALPQMDLDRAKGELDTARAAVFTAQAKLDEATLNLGYATITSPVTVQARRAAAPGRIRELACRQCQPHLRGRARSDVGDLQHLAEPDGALPGAGREEARGGARRTTTSTWSSCCPTATRIRSADAWLCRIPRSARGTRSFTVRAVIPNPKSELRPGMFVSARLLGAVRPNAIVVPQLAVQQGSNGHAVFVVNPSGAAEVRPVIVGDYIGDKDIVILAGLAKGDRVIVEGTMRVVPGQPVKIAAEAAPPAPAAPKAIESARPADAKKK